MSLFQKALSFFKPKQKIRFQLPKAHGLSPKKQAELEVLYYQLLSNKEYITSGKLQFLGLEKIRKKLGKRWAGLRLLVYETAEAVITETIDKSDLFFSYNEDSYIILFVREDPEASQKKVNAIAEEIRRRLFTLDEDELKTLEIKKALQKIDIASFLNREFPEILENDFGDLDTIPKNVRRKRKLSDAEREAVNTDRYKASQAALIIKGITVECVYSPLWEVRRGALTTYLCVGRTDERIVTSADKLALDIAILNKVIQELRQMEQDGRKLYIMCPVHYTTLYTFESYEAYKVVCETITEIQRQFLIFLVMSPQNGRFMRKDDFWFAKPLKSYAYNVFIELPVKYELNLQHVKNFGVDGVGIRLDPQLAEIDNIQILTVLGSKAKYFKIPKTFALDVPSLSITTSLVCAGYDYLGGHAIHDTVEKPDTIHQYRYEDLLSEMIKS